MCQFCKTKPVYEFTNKRKLCKTCFIRYFQKKVLYTIRKYSMIKPNDIIGYKSGKDFRGVVLEDVLKMFAEKSTIELVKLQSFIDLEIAHAGALDINKKQLMKKYYINNIKKSRAKRDKLIKKIAINSTIDLEANEIISTLIQGNVKDLKKLKPVDWKIIKPLYLFLDEEILLYAKLKKLKFKRINMAPKGVPSIKGDINIEGNKISIFIDELEKRHPEVKRAVVKGCLELCD